MIAPTLISVSLTPGSFVHLPAPATPVRLDAPAAPAAKTVPPNASASTSAVALSLRQTMVLSPLGC